MEKNVLFICKGHQNIAGAQLYLKQVVKVFPLNKYKLHYAFQSKDGTRVFDEIGKIRCIKKLEYDWRHLPSLDSFHHGRAIFNKIRPEFVIFNSVEDKIIPSIFAALLCGVKNKILIVHWAQNENSLPLWVTKKGIPFPIISRYSLRTRLKRLVAYLLLDKLIFVNNNTRKAYIKLYKVKPNKCKTIYNGIDVDRYRSLDNIRNSMRAELDVSENMTLILATGNLTSVKGHEVLINAIKILIEQGKPIKCFIAGQGELQLKLENLIKQNKIVKQCVLLGYRDDIPALLSASDIFCMPSLNEALGYSILEAMASGKPVIASNVGGIPEVITNGKEGILIAPGDPLKICNATNLLLNDRNLRQSLGVAGLKKVNKSFSAQNMVKYTARFIDT